MALRLCWRLARYSILHSCRLHSAPPLPAQHLILRSLCMALSLLWGCARAGGWPGTQLRTTAACTLGEQLTSLHGQITLSGQTTLSLLWDLLLLC